MSIALLLTAVGVARTFTCEAEPSPAMFLTRNFKLMQAVPPKDEKKSPFKITVTDTAISIDQIDGLPPPKGLRRFEKIKDEPVATYYSPSSLLYRTGTAEPTVLMFVMVGESNAMLLTSTAIAIAAHGGDSESNGAFLPAFQAGRASCVAVEVAK